MQDPLVAESDFSDGRYQGEELSTSRDVGGYAEGWYDAAAAASRQYSRPQQGGNEWYSGDSSGGAAPSSGEFSDSLGKDGNAIQSSNDWYSGPDDDDDAPGEFIYLTAALKAEMALLDISPDRQFNSFACRASIRGCPS